MTRLSLCVISLQLAVCFCAQTGCAQEKQPLFISRALRSISGEAGKLCLELCMGLQATSVRTSLFNLKSNLNYCEESDSMARAPAKRVTCGQPEACGGRSDFPQACVTRYRAFWVYHSALWKTGHMSSCRTVWVIYHTINRLCGSRVTFDLRQAKTKAGSCNCLWFFFCLHTGVLNAFLVLSVF